MTELELDSLISECRGLPGGRIFKGRFKKSKKDFDEVVVKMYNLDQVVKQSQFEDAVGFIANEAITMRQFKHPNLSSCLDTFVRNSDVVLIMPKMTFGSVRDLLDSHFGEGLPETAIAFIMRDVLQGLNYLHSKAIVHRSVRASHILLSEFGPAKLSGFRYSCSLIQSGEGIQDRYDYPLHVANTNLNWLSPEFLQQNLLGYNEKSDIYSLGVTACESANGIIPYSEMPATLILLEKLRGSKPKLIDSTTYTSIDANFTSDQPSDSGVGSSSNMSAKNKDSMYARRTFSNAFHQFIEDSSQLDALMRPNGVQLLNHAFIKQLKRSSMSMASIMESVKSIGPSEDNLIKKQKVTAESATSKQFEEVTITEDWLF